MFNPYPHPPFPVSDSPKPSTFPSKSGVYSLRNLTVLYYLIYPAICANFAIRSNRLLSQLGNLPVSNLSLYRFQGSSLSFELLFSRQR